ncbi:hypothetical protein [Alkalibacillus haloalkaliphilus]|uniref:Uncharacterized protein n=1 Tax=Alkalibacillus haloalkaliphilus TaxID=94136 RepID=A0A511W3A8_9BACI|nr:hypothetical protein [Alkalibacillus haloalkaliphilus]GEN45576.1 hypothetical protein AHA02nite_13520 [Alkalibacillus haloalkaliphilus]
MLISMFVVVLAVLLSVLASFNFKGWTAPVFTFVTYVGFHLIADLYRYGVTSLFETIAANWLHIIVLMIFATAIRYAVTAFEERRTKVFYIFGMVCLLAVFDLIAQAQTTTFGEVVEEELGPDLLEITILGEQSSDDIVIDDEELIDEFLNDYRDMTLRGGVLTMMRAENSVRLQARSNGGRTLIMVDEHGIRLSLDTYRVEDDNGLYEYLNEIIEEEQE